MKITRNYAIEMFRMLGAMALGHLDDDTLSATLDNFDKCRKVQEDYQKLAEELAKRLYEGVDEEKKKAFFEVIGNFEREKNIEKKREIEALMKDSYADLYPLYRKQLSVLTQLVYKEVEVEITEVDKDAFVKGIVKGKKDAPVHEIEAVFAPLFKKEEEKEEKDDFSELDELLND